MKGAITQIKRGMLFGAALLLGGMIGGAAALPLKAQAVSAPTEDISESTGDFQEDESTRDVTLHGLTFAADYEEVYEALKKGYYGGRLYPIETGAVEEMAVEDSAEPQMKISPTDGAGDYSQTNLRTQGVDEGDIVKTDGTHIYVLEDGRTLRIYRVEDQKVSPCTALDLPFVGENASARELFVDGSRLCILYDYTVPVEDDWYYYISKTVVQTWDISDPAAVTLSASWEQDGSYLQSRKVGDMLYVYSNHYPIIKDTYEESDIVPRVDGKEIAASSVCIPAVITDGSYLLVSSVDITRPDQVADTKALVSGGSELYVSETALYAMNLDYYGSFQRTEIVKFSCSEGRIEGEGGCYLRGYVNDSFSVDEYQGRLRVLITYTGSEYGAFLEALGDLLGFDYYDNQRWVRHNALYVLDAQLNRISKLDGIAEGEEIRSARYFGDTVYFVTFENTDPLFTADLSDPEHPVLVGEVKLTGFSSYLHPYGEGKLLGIGYEAREETGEVTGLKLSMFDITDPTHVVEENRYVLEGITWCPAIENYKSILADPGKNLIGFYCDDRYLIFSWDPRQGFTRRLLYDFYEDMLNGKVSADTLRGLYIGQKLYLAGADFVISFDMSQDFLKEGVCRFPDAD